VSPTFWRCSPKNKFHLRLDLILITICICNPSYLFILLFLNDLRRKKIFVTLSEPKCKLTITFKILFSDEAKFFNNGSVNKHNRHYYAQENPLWIRETHFQRIVSVNVWCGIFGDNLTGEIYLNFWQNILGPILENLPLAAYRGLWFQHDGAPTHYHKHVRQYLGHIYNHQWIGRGALNAWPPRSSDMTPLEFFLWGAVKEQVYATPIHRSYRNA
jgi:hypothetical protein